LAKAFWLSDGSYINFLGTVAKSTQVAFFFIKIDQVLHEGASWRGLRWLSR